jgi:hypothetical protein
MATLSVQAESDDCVQMSDNLAPLRRVEELLSQGRTLHSIVTELQMLFGLAFTDAMAAVAATKLVNARGLSVPAARS